MSVIVRQRRSAMAARARSTRRPRWRSSIPRDVYERVRDLALAIAGFRLQGDGRRARAAYRILDIYCREQESLGRRHPFLRETLADFSRSPSEALKLYHSALRLCRRMGEQQHTILLSLGRLHLKSGSIRAARRVLVAAEREAIRREDREDAAEARQLLNVSRLPNRRPQSKRTCDRR